MPLTDPRPGLARLTAVGAAVLLLAAPGAALAAAPAPAPNPGADKTAPSDPKVLTFGVQAATRTKPDARPNFTYTAVQGGQILDYLSVSNYSNAPVSLRIYAGDAFTTIDGGFDLTAAKTRPRDVGAWVKIANPRVTLAPRTRSILPFRLTVPTSASPGDHAGGVIASLTTTSRNKRGDVVTVEHRLAERIYLRVPGALRAGLTVTELTGSYRDTLNPAGRGAATVRYRLTNSGNLRLGATVSTRVSNLLDARRTGPARSVPELLPGNSLILVEPAAHVSPLLRATAHVHVDPVRLGPAGDPTAPVVTAAAGFWTISKILLLLAAVAGVAVVIHRRRFGNKSAGAHAAPRRLSHSAATTSKAEVS